jgi:hypothetical protein
MVLLLYLTKYDGLYRPVGSMKIEEEVNQSHREVLTLNTKMERKNILQNHCQLKTKSNQDNFFNFKTTISVLRSFYYLKARLFFLN